MSLHAIGHFQGILAPTIVPPSNSSVQWFRQLCSFRCPPSLSQLLSSWPSHAEISPAILKLNPNKSPGPDGFTSGFFKAAWVLIGKEVVDSIMNFFFTGFLPSATNATILSLVPKRPGTTSISDYRPISCCSTI